MNFSLAVFHVKAFVVLSNDICACATMKFEKMVSYAKAMGAETRHSMLRQHEFQIAIRLALAMRIEART